jgi:predicted AlkP superfamily phosphohydrolase/phosphomutase
MEEGRSGDRQARWADSRGAWSGGASALERVLVGAALGLLVGSVALVAIVASNPLFLDSIALGLVFFALAPLAVGAILGALVRTSRRTLIGGGPSSVRRPPRRWCVVLLAAASCLALAVTLTARALEAGATGRPSDRSLQLLVVVIDGASWDVAQPMLDSGRLPNLARAIEVGSSGTLRSVPPMFSPTIYTSIASGKVADKHGVRGPEDHSSDAVLVRRVWDILGEELGWDYGVVEWHATCPPEASPHGFMVPGWLSATHETVPPELTFLTKLRATGRAGRASGVSYVGLAMAAARHGARISTLLEMALIAVDRRFGNEPLPVMNIRQHRALVRIITGVTRRQIQKRRVQMLAIAYASTDAVSHRFWRYHEPEAFRGVDPESVRRYGSAIEDTYAAVDEQLGPLMECLAPDGLLIILSDHGFEAVQQVYAEVRVLRTDALLGLVGIGRDEVTYVKQGPQVFVRAVATDEAEGARTRERLARACSSVVVSGSGLPAFAVEEVDRPGTGDDYVRVAPTEDLIKAAMSGGEVVAGDGAKLQAAALLTVFANTGWHALDGIIVMAGGPFKQGVRIEDASVLDVTPTILTALGLPFARDMDGTVIVDALTDSFLAAHPVTTVGTYESQGVRSRDSSPDGELPAEVRERLRALGYVD